MSRYPPAGHLPIISNVNPQKRADDKANKETQRCHTKTQSSHLKKTPFERHILCSRDVVIEKSARSLSPILLSVLQCHQTTIRYVRACLSRARQCPPRQQIRIAATTRTAGNAQHRDPSNVARHPLDRAQDKALELDDHHTANVTGGSTALTTGVGFYCLCIVEGAQVKTPSLSVPAKGGTKGRAPVASSRRS
jgi:hypothetical protein